MAVSGGKIIAVGTNKEIRAWANERTRVVDVKGRLVVPGFNDAHVHFAAIGNRFSAIDLRGVRSAEQMAAKLAEYTRFLPQDRWILGGGFDPQTGTGEGGELRRLVDRISADNPVFVYTSDATKAFANGVALSKARITGTTPDPAGGTIGRGPDGEPDGMLSGVAIRLVADLVPANHSRNWPEILETATNYAASLGVTSVQDMSTDELADVYRQLDRAGKLKTRIYDCAGMEATAKLAERGVRAATGDPMIRTGCVKYFSEGEEEEPPQLRREIAAADKAGLQVMIHAIGPRANRNTLDAFAWAAARNGPRDRRLRVEHAHNAAWDDLSRFGRSGIIASMQPGLFQGTDASVYKQHSRLRTHLAFGSDAAIADLDPIRGILAATEGPNAIGMEEAVYAYTAGSAYAEFQENVKGKIKAGNLADVVILSDNIFARTFSRQSDVRVHLTIVNGNIVYESERS